MQMSAPSSTTYPFWAEALSRLPDIDRCWQEPLARHTTFRVGGPVACLARPRSEAALVELMRWLRCERVPHFVLGAGSNVLAPDEPWEMVAVQLQRCCNTLEEVRPEQVEDGEPVVGSGRRVANVVGAGSEDRPGAGAAPPPDCHLQVGSGVRLARLMGFCLRNALTGLESLVGIPGSVGGALAMNAGTGSGAIGDALIKMTMLDAAGNRCTLERSQLNIGYRCLVLPPGALILNAVLGLQRGVGADIKRQVRALMVQRRRTQPLGWPSAGCIFKNPPGRSAGALIDQAGIKGLRLGDAQVSLQHANWIVNLGQASARDIVALIGLIEERVYQRFGVRLEREVKVLGG
jgi:UDP-N-acetylmuramate dehydrogenase